MQDLTLNYVTPSEWRVDAIVETPLPGFEDIPNPVPHLVNDRGATLVRLSGGGRELQERFHYQDGDVAFDFFALRFDGTEKKIITDTYSVVLPKPFRIPSAEVPIETIERIKRDLNGALKIYPSRFPPPQCSPLPEIKNVHFY